MSGQPAFIASIKNAAITLVNGDGTTAKTLVSGGANGSRLKALHITSTDSVARTLQLIATIGAVDYVLGEIVVPVTAGTDGVTAAVSGLASSLIAALQTDGVSKFLDIANGTTLKIRPKVAVTAAQTIYIFAEYGDI